MEQPHPKPHLPYVEEQPTIINTMMSKREPFRSKNAFVNNLGNQVSSQNTLSLQDTSIRSEAPLISDQTMIDDHNMLPGQILGINLNNI